MSAISMRYGTHTSVLFVRSAVMDEKRRQNVSWNVEQNLDFSGLDC